MKKSYLKIISAIVAIIILIIIVYFFGMMLVDKGENIKSDEENQINNFSNNISEVGKTPLLSESEPQNSFVSHSPIKEYKMQATGKLVHIYEIYENGYCEKIQTLDIDASLLPCVDRDNLNSGIVVSSWEQICNLIEDFSS